jgi:hypothetical protein
VVGLVSLEKSAAIHDPAKIILVVTVPPRCAGDEYAELAAD